MSVIIRLQNLPWSANSLDIRQYFRGLSIPEGGVHIVGGEMGDAFIAFSTDEDARQAMMLGGGKIKEVQISLMLSSRSEMQKVIEAARQASMTNSLAQLLVPVQPVVQIPTIPQQPLIGAGIGKERRDSKGDKKDSSDLSSGSYESSRRDRRDKSRSRSRERNRKDRRDRERDRDRDRERDRRRRSRSRSKSRERRRRRSRSRSKGREIHRDRKDIKDDIRKEKEITPGTSAPQVETGKNIPSLDTMGGNSWNMMPQGGTIGQNPPLLNNFELLRNLANQRGPLIPEGPNFMAMNSMNQEMPDNLDKFATRNDSPRDNFTPRPNDFRQNENGQRFNNYDESGFQENIYEGGYRGPNSYQNSGPGYQRNGNEPMPNPRFNNFQRNDNFRGGNRERGGVSRGLLDFPTNIPQRDDRFSNRQDRNANRDDGIDEFGRSIQLRNRKNISNEENYKEGSPSGFPGFASRFGNTQQNQPPSLLRGREWPPGVRHEGFPERRGRGTFDETTGFRVNKPREPFRKYHEEEPVRYTERDCCVELRNLAPHIAYGEVRRPFSNMKLIIKEIKFFDYTHKDKKCRIRFLNNDNKRKAMQASSKVLIDNKHIQLLHINDSDFDEIQDEGVKRPDVRFSDDEEDSGLSPKEVCVQVKDLPMNVTEEDIAKMFPNTGIEKVIVEECGDGKSKAGYVKFEKAVDCKVALGTPNRSIGDSVVFLEPLPLYEFNNIMHRQTETVVEPTQPDLMEVPMEEPQILEEPQMELMEKSSCVLMKNLPFEANDRDICDFFSDIGLVPNKIHLMLDMSGHPSGDAFCEFSDVEQAERACTKHTAPLGKNAVTVLHVTQEEMLEALGVADESELEKEEDPSETFGRPGCVLALENIPFRASPFDIIKFFGWSYSLTEHDILRRYNERGQPTGDARVCVKTPDDAVRAVRFLNNRSMMGRVIRMKIL